MSYIKDLIENTDKVLEERNSTHGDFTRNAEISQALKAVFHANLDASATKVHLEAMDMIALKLSRILSGQSNFEDHWADIAGYAVLAARACK